MQDIYNFVFTFVIAGVFYFALLQIFNENFDIKSSLRFTTLLLIGSTFILLSELLPMPKLVSNIVNVFGGLCVINGTIYYFSDKTIISQALISIGIIFSAEIVGILLKILLKAVMKKSK